jgi:glucose-6-phosphate-specific signal transduction histidine kinase
MHVEDDGVGFDVQEAFSRRDCFGLSGLRERVALLGGTLTVTSLPKTKAGASAGKDRTPRRSDSKRTGTIGVDRHGSSFHIELPIPRVESPHGTWRSKDRQMRQPARRRSSAG